jgi:hypothetical protein
MEQRAGAAVGGDLVPRAAPPAPGLWLQRRPGTILFEGPGGFFGQISRFVHQFGYKKFDIEGDPKK